MDTKFETALAEFVQDSQNKITELYKQYKLSIPTLTVNKRGKKFWRIVRVDGGSRSAWGFIDITTGDILKAASWASPAKHPRGNIFDKESWKTVTPYGPAYLR